MTGASDVITVARYLTTGLAEERNEFAAANAGIPNGSKNGVPSLRLSHPTGNQILK